MPLYDVVCLQCNKKEERLVKFIDKDKQICRLCNVVMKTQVPLFARTPARFGDSAGGYDISLGKHFNNSMEKEKWIKDNGLVSSSDIGGKGAVDDLVHKQIVDTDNHIKDVSTYEYIKKETGSVERALAETFSVDVMKSRGLLDSDINSGL